MDFEYLEQYHERREELFKKYRVPKMEFPAEFIKKDEELKVELNEKSIKKYPPDPPNSVCNYALISGILIENNFRGKLHEFIPFFKSEFEQIYIWKHTKNKDSSIISKVDDDKIKSLRFWKNIAHVIDLADTFSRAFESSEKNFDYNWIYYFDRKNSLDESKIYSLSDFDKRTIKSGIQISLKSIEKISITMELLLRDDVFYTALTQLKSAFELHPFCFLCESGYSQMHEHEEEPKRWEHSYYIPKMETAILQACRSVESILGEPPNKKNKGKVIKFKNKWKEILGKDPDDIFEQTGSSYIEFYYKLFFVLRNPSAHSFGKINYALERKRAIESQCFATEIVSEYHKCNVKSYEEVLSIMCFNTDLLKRVNEHVTTYCDE